MMKGDSEAQRREESCIFKIFVRYEELNECSKFELMYPVVSFIT